MNLNKILLDPESMIVIAIIELHNRLRHGGLGYDSIKSTLMNMLYSDLQSFKLTPEDVNALVTVIVTSCLKPSFNEKERTIYFILNDNCIQSAEAFFFNVKDYIKNAYPSANAINTISTAASAVTGTLQQRSLQQQRSQKPIHSSFSKAVLSGIGPVSGNVSSNSSNSSNSRSTGSGIDVKNKRTDSSLTYHPPPPPSTTTSVNSHYSHDHDHYYNQLSSFHFNHEEPSSFSAQQQYLANAARKDKRNYQNLQRVDNNIPPSVTAHPRTPYAHAHNTTHLNLDHTHAHVSHSTYSQNQVGLGIKHFMASLRKVCMDLIMPKTVHDKIMMCFVQLGKAYEKIAHREAIDFVYAACRYSVLPDLKTVSKTKLRGALTLFKACGILLSTYADDLNDLNTVPIAPTAPAGLGIESTDAAAPTSPALLYLNPEITSYRKARENHDNFLLEKYRSISTKTYLNAEEWSKIFWNQSKKDFQQWDIEMTANIQAIQMFQEKEYQSICRNEGLAAPGSIELATRKMHNDHLINKNSTESNNNIDNMVTGQGLLILNPTFTTTGTSTGGSKQPQSQHQQYSNAYSSSSSQSSHSHIHSYEGQEVRGLDPDYFHHHSNPNHNPHQQPNQYQHQQHHMNEAHVAMSVGTQHLVMLQQQSQSQASSATHSPLTSNTSRASMTTEATETSPSSSSLSPTFSCIFKEMRDDSHGYSHMTGAGNTSGANLKINASESITYRVDQMLYHPVPNTASTFTSTSTSHDSGSSKQHQSQQLEQQFQLNPLSNSSPWNYCGLLGAAPMLQLGRKYTPIAMFDTPIDPSTVDVPTSYSVSSSAVTTPELPGGLAPPSPPLLAEEAATTPPKLDTTTTQEENEDNHVLDIKPKDIDAELSELDLDTDLGFK